MTNEISPRQNGSPATDCPTRSEVNPRRSVTLVPLEFDDEEAFDIKWADFSEPSESNLSSEWLYDEAPTIPGDPLAVDRYARKRRRMRAFHYAIACIVAGLTLGTLTGFMAQALMTSSVEATATMPSEPPSTPEKEPSPVQHSLESIVVEAGDSFTRLMSPHTSEAVDAARAAQSKYDLSQIKVGHTFWLQKDPRTGELLRVDYEITKGETLRIERSNGTWTAYLNSGDSLGAKAKVF